MTKPRLGPPPSPISPSFLPSRSCSAPKSLPVVLLLQLLYLCATTAMVVYPASSCTGPCSTDSGLCTTSECVTSVDHTTCAFMPGYVLTLDSMVPDESDCLDNGCTSASCLQGYEKVHSQMCVNSATCTTLFCYEETCCKLKRNITCCATQQCEVEYQACQVPQQMAEQDTATSSVYMSSVGHNGSVTFPFYSQQTASQGVVCEQHESWGLCFCNDGKLEPGCDPNHSETWYDLGATSSSAPLPAGLWLTCRTTGATNPESPLISDDSSTASSGGSTRTQSQESGAGGGFVLNTMSLVLLSLGAACAVALLALALFAVSRAVRWRYQRIKISSNYHTLAAEGKMWGSKDGGGGVRKGGGRDLSSVPEEDEVFTLDDLGHDIERGTSVNRAMKRHEIWPAETETSQLPISRGKHGAVGGGTSTSHSEKQSLLNSDTQVADSTAHVFTPRYTMHEDEDEDDEGGDGDADHMALDSPSSGQAAWMRRYKQDF